MNLLSINIRGVGESKKADWIRGLKTCNGAHFVAIQETKAIGLMLYVVNRFWGRSIYEFDSVDAFGRSGGILSIWDPSYFHKIGSLKHRRFLVTSGVIRPLNCVVSIINIYAPNDPAERKILWYELLEIRRTVPGLCVFVGDFNEVRGPDDRRNSDFVAANANAFNEFIERAELEEYQMGGGMFTYISDKGDKYSKLDRILVCKEFMNRWPLASLLLLAKDCSDHRPLLLRSVASDFGHTPFRFFNSWLDLSGFEDFVGKKCNQFKFEGPADLALSTKFRWLKNQIKWWLAKHNKLKDGTLMKKKRDSPETGIGGGGQTAYGYRVGASLRMFGFCKGV
ncbi:uncharacterized protein LOC143603041 [Bidens hawaiensis]|uniref:uncharacterized protein LOC143603041 n=1 Tax=Bidens hawaiensis TaxID=980011 RepID=UPI00404BA0ED